MKSKYIITTILIFLAVTNLFAQKEGQDLIDSLMNELPRATEDTNKVNLLNEIAFGYIHLSPEQGIEFANQGIELANKLNWKEGLAKNYNALMQNYWSIGDFDLAIDMYNLAVKIEDELGYFKQTETSKLTSINRTFTYPSSDFTNLTSELRRYLPEVANYMKENLNVVISITGHSDNFGTFDQNDSRSRERAEKVMEFLERNGISKRRLLANHKGSLEPVARNDTEDGRKRNRRVVIRAIGQ